MLRCFAIEVKGSGGAPARLIDFDDGDRPESRVAGGGVGRR